MKIKHINDISAIIEADNNFIIAKRDGYLFVDYQSSKTGKHQFAIVKDCKGVKFDTSGKIIARPFHKFLDITHTLENYPPDQIATVSEKLDGVLIHPVKIYGALVLMTRRGRTQIAVNAETLLTPEIEQECLSLIEKEVTPLFEYTSPDYRNVIQYPVNKLTLLAIRENISGAYWSEQETSSIAYKMSVDQPAKQELTIADFKKYLSNAKNIKGKKGFVCRIGNDVWGHFLTNYYHRKHSLKENINDEKEVLSLILQNHIDDVIPLLSQREKEAIKYYRKRVHVGIGRTTEKLHHIIMAGTKLDHATFTHEHLKEHSPVIRLLALSLRNGKYNSPYEAIHSLLMEHINTKQDIENLRDIIQTEWP